MYVGPEGDAAAFEDIEDLRCGPLAAVLTTGGEPDELREVNGGDKGGFFGFDDGDG